MKEIKAKLLSVPCGSNDELGITPPHSQEVQVDGFINSKYCRFTRTAADWDPEPTGTVRRNEWQWSGVSLEEIEIIWQRMNLKESLSASTLGANICVEGIPNFSMLPKGSKLIFPSTAVLIVEEENLPCLDMGLNIEKNYTSQSGKKVVGKYFPKHALHLRGVVGIVDIPGLITAGDEIIVQIYQSPLWSV